MPWVTYDQQGCIAGVTTNPCVGAVEVATLDPAKVEADFAIRRAEKFARLPVEARIRLARERMADELAAADHWSRSPNATPEQRKRAADIYAKLDAVIGAQ